MIHATSWGGRKIPGAPGHGTDAFGSFSLHKRSLQLAALLEGGDGPLGRALSAAATADLAAAANTLAPAERAALRRDAGAAWGACLDLAQESSPEIFYQELVVLAAQADRQGQAALSGRILASLAAGGSDVPAPLARRAAQELALRRGSGPWARQFAHGLNEGLKEAVHPALWAGMAAGNIAFSAGKFWASERLAAWGARGWTLPVLSAAGGLVGEAGAFLLASKGVRTFAGGVSWDPLGTGQEFGHVLLTMGALRLGGFASERLARTVQGMETPAVWAQAQARALQNGGSYFGLVAGHAAAVQLGWEERRPWSSLLAGSGAELLAFSAGARMARSVLGPSFTNWENEAASRALRKPPSGPWNGIILDGFRAAPVASGTRGIVEPGLLPDARGLWVLSSGSGEGGAPKRPRLLRSAAFKAKEAKERETAKVNSVEALLAWIRGETGYLRKQILIDKNHITFLLPRRGNFDREPIVPLLNSLDYLSELPRGRRVRIAFEDEAPPVDYIKLGSHFVVRDGAIASGLSVKAQRNRVDARARDVRSVAERLEQLALRPWQDKGGRYPGMDHFPVFLSSYDGLRSYLNVAKVRFGRGDYGPLVLRGLDAKVKDLEAQTKSSGFLLPNDVHLEIWSTLNRQTFVGRRDGMGIRWRAYNSQLWETMSAALPSVPHNARNSLELYLLIHSLTAPANQNPRSVTVIRYLAPNPPGSLTEMLLLHLRELHPEGAEIRIEFPAAKLPPLRLVREQNIWKEK